MHDDSSPIEGGDVPANANALAKGTRLFEFEIERVLGEGGFAIVYLAFDHSLHRRVALKEYLPAEFAFRRDVTTVVLRSQQHQQTFEAGRKNFVQEARFLAQFEHPSLVKVHRVFESHGTAYMVQGYYPGQSLGAAIKSGRRYATEAELRPVVAALLGAVELLHTRQCLHRDIAPDNIIIQPNGVPVLLDFGAARRIIGDVAQALTAVLKPSFAPIEQYTEDGGLAQGPWTDVYALAATLRMAITGKPPPSSVGRTIKDALVKLADDPPPNFGLTFLRGIDAGLALLPAERPQSIAEFRNAMGLPADEEGTTPPTVKSSVVAASAPRAESTTPSSPSTMRPPPPVAPATAAAPTPAAADATVLGIPAVSVPRSRAAVPPPPVRTDPVAAAHAAKGAAPRRRLKRSDVMLIVIAAAALGLMLIIPFAADWIWSSPASPAPSRAGTEEQRAQAPVPAPRPPSSSPAPATVSPAPPAATPAQPPVAAAAPAPTPAPPPAASTPASPSTPAPSGDAKDGKAAALPERPLAPAPVAPPLSPPKAVAAAPEPPVKQEPPPKPPAREPGQSPTAPSQSTSLIPAPAQPVTPGPAPLREEPPPKVAAVPPSTLAAPSAPGEPGKARRALVRIAGEPPVYPRDAIRAGIETGRVVALVTVDAQGNVASVDIVRSEPPRVFDRAARTALAAWKFKAEGERYQGEVELRFSLKE